MPSFLHQLNKRKTQGIIVNKRFPHMLQPDAIRRAYMKQLQTFLAPMLTEVNSRLDSFDGILRSFFGRSSLSVLRSIVSVFATRTETFQEQQIKRASKEVLGIDLFFNDRRLQSALDSFVKQNVDLISDIPRTFFGEIEDLVAGSFRFGTTDLAKKIAERFSVSMSRAQLIARDQIGKLFGQVAQLRQEELGVDAYIWRTSKDSRVRDSHDKREGQRFTWDNPPIDGHPGNAIQCRCYAEPDLTGIF